MQLVGREALQKALRKHADARNWISAWVNTVQDADWLSLDDVRADYPSADGVRLKSLIVITVFNVKGNTYRLLTRINYADRIVAALELLTHAEYNKDQWKERY